MALSLSGTTGIVTGNIGTLQVTTGRLANDAVTTVKILDANVTPAKLSQPMTLETAKAYNWNGLTTNTSLDFTGIPSWVKCITVMFNGVSIDSSSNLLIQIGDSGGIENIGYLSGSSNYVSYQSETIGFLLAHNNSASGTWGGSIKLSLLNFSLNNWVSAGNLNDSSASAQVMVSAGAKSLSATLDRVRITTFSGTANFDAGSINIMYEG